MIEAELPDGSILEFPDGTGQDVVQAAVKKHLGVGDGKPGPWRQPDMIDSIYQGATFGWGDEAFAALDATLRAPFLKRSWRDVYKQTLSEQRARNNQFSEQHPLQNLAGEIVGSTLVPVGPAAEGAKDFWSLVRAGAKTGAIAGGVAGAGYADGGLENRLTGAGLGAAIGAPVGAAAGAVVPLARGSVNAVRNGLPRWFGGRSADERAAAEIAKALERSDLTPEEVARRVKDARDKGIPLTPADLSKSTRRLARTIETNPSRASERLTDQLEERQTGQGARVSSQLEKALGNDGDFHGAVSDIVNERAKAAKPLYDKAYEGSAWSDDLKGLLDRPAMKRAHARAKEIAANEGVAIGEPPSMRTWDYIKRGLDDEIEKYRDTTTGRLVLDENGRALVTLRKQLLDALDAANPDYKAARSVFAGHSELLDALHLGRAFARGDEEVVASRFGKLSQPEKDMFRIGAVRELKGMIDRAPDGADVVRRIFGSPERRNRLAMLFDTEDQFREFAQRMELERETSRTRHFVLGNSQSLRISADQDDLLSDAVTHIIGGGSMWSAIRGVGARAWNAAKGLDEETAGKIAEYLMGQNPDLVLPPAQHARILKEMQTNKDFRRMVLRAARALGATGGMMAAPKSTPDTNGLGVWLTQP